MDMDMENDLDPISDPNVLNAIVLDDAEAIEAIVLKKKRGRPKGSKNNKNRTKSPKAAPAAKRQKPNKSKPKSKPKPKPKTPSPVPSDNSEEKVIEVDVDMGTDGLSEEDLDRFNSEGTDDTESGIEERSEDEESIGSLADFIVADEEEDGDVEPESPSEPESKNDGIDHSNIITGKRRRKPVTRYLDPDYWKLMTKGEDEKEIEEFVAEVKEDLENGVDVEDSTGSDVEVDPNDLETTESEDYESDEEMTDSDHVPSDDSYEPSE
jgi:hypothetical protein